MAKTSTPTLFFLFLAASLSWANSARVLLDEVEDQPHVVPQLGNQDTFAIPGAWTPATGLASIAEEGEETEPPVDVTTPNEDVAAPVANPTNEDMAPDTNLTVTSPTPNDDVETPGDDVINPEPPADIPTDDDVAPNTSPTTISSTRNDDVETPGDDLATSGPPTNVATTNGEIGAPIATPIVDDMSPTATSATSTANMGTPRDDVAPKPIPTATSATPVSPSTTVAHDATLSFFMHDIFGGSHPSTRVVTGLIAHSKVSPIPFSKPNNNLFPLQGGTPLLTGNLNNLINNPKNVPFLTGLTGAKTTTIIPNSGNTNNLLSNKNQPFVSAESIQNLMFGAITVIDDELTEGHELGSDVIGKAQGFYLVSSIDGTSHTIALTVILHSGERDREIGDTISFFGVHRTATAESHIAVVGGTGKYENSGGYAAVETIHPEDQHVTDGVDTILNFSVFLTQ